MAATSFPKNKIEIQLFEKIHPAAVSLLKEEKFRVEAEAKAPADRALKAVLESAHAVGIRSRTNLTSLRIEKARRLLVVGCFCVGTNNVNLEAATKAGIPVFHAPYSSTRSVAELTLGLILSLARQLVSKSHLARKGVWDKSAEGCYEVRGKTLGIIGYGHIGSQVSVLAESLGMRILFHDVSDVQPLGNANGVGSLAVLLKQSDFVTLHVPGGDGTKNLISQAQMRIIKKGAYLINTSRGTVVNEEALVAAIKSGRLAGAALDVLNQEPATPRAKVSSPLLGLDQVILTPHVGGSTTEAQERIARSVAEKMVRFINQGSTRGAVNFPNLELPRTPNTHRIMHIHRNVPGVLSSVNNILSELGANVEAQFLKTSDLIGYLVVDIDCNVSGKVMDGLETLSHTIRTRRLF